MKLESKPNLAKAIISVMAEVKGMEKNSRVGGNSSTAYDGTKYSDVAERFNEVMVKNGLCILPIGIEETTQIDRWEEVDPWSKETPKATKTKQSVFSKVITKYLLLHESGESEVLMGYGHGIDPQDKGAGKATTYALKNVLLYAFLTPVGKMDDTDKTHSEDIPTPQASTKTNVPIQLDPTSALNVISLAKSLDDLTARWHSLSKGEQELVVVKAKATEMKTKLK